MKVPALLKKVIDYYFFTLLFSFSIANIWIRSAEVLER